MMLQFQFLILPHHRCRMWDEVLGAARMTSLIF
jgi:hypothetical protein